MNDEFEDRLTQISAAIDQVRTTSGKDRRDLLDALFRNVHSLKAAAHANGLNDLAARAHEFEDLLHSVRTGKASLDDLTDFDPPQSTQAGNAIPAEIRDSLKDEERYRLAECVRENASIYLVETNFEVSDFDRQFQQLKQELNDNGEVIATAPMTEHGKINFRILYATKSDLFRIVDQAVRAGRAVAEAQGKEVDFSMRVDGSLDKSICDALADPLMHLVRNAVDHGIETKGHVAIEATETRIVVKDDGRGIDPSIREKMFAPGFSTARQITITSGRGVGLDVVKTAIEQLGGAITVSSEPGKGATFEITLAR
ncbi:MAG TPA: ATP-binding protein [Pyrinomonadaceae bacterium]|nr:ATP-binding protein [Pyrinomonadaceae bacterium]